MRASLVLSEIGIGLRRNLTMTIAAVVTVMISLLLLGFSLLIRDQIDVMKGFWYDKIEVSVFLCGDNGTPRCPAPVTEAQRQDLLSDLQAMPQVEKVYYESKQEAYERFQEQFRNSPDLVKNVTVEALPESFRVKLKDPEQFEIIRSAFSGRPGVDQVQDQRALLEQFFQILNIFQVGALVVALASVLAAILLIFNTVRVAAFGRRRETGIMKLVGASNLYIQLPFLLEGVLAGLFGALLASGTLAIFKTAVIDGVLKESFRFTAFVGWGDVLGNIVLLIVVGVVLSGVASFLTLRRYLRV